MKLENILKKKKAGFLKKLKTFAFLGMLGAGILFSPKILKAQNLDHPRLGVVGAGRTFHENVFIRPDTSTTLFYGSGDANKDGKIDSLDYQAIINGIKNDESDVNGDGKTDSTDARILKEIGRAHV